MYFVQIENSGPIKIGITKDPHKRLNELQVSNPYKLKLLYFTPCCRKDEETLHGILRKNNLNIRGEWFWPDNKVFREINELKYFDKKTGYDWQNSDPDSDFADTRLGVVK